MLSRCSKINIFPKKRTRSQTLLNLFQSQLIFTFTWIKQNKEMQTVKNNSLKMEQLAQIENQLKSFSNIQIRNISQNILSYIESGNLKQNTKEKNINDLGELTHRGNSIIRILTLVKKLDFNSKREIRKSIIHLIEAESTQHADILKTFNRKFVQNQSFLEFLNCAFKFYSLCFSNNYHSQSMYEHGFKEFVITDYIFQDNTPKRLPVAMLYLNTYEKRVDNASKRELIIDEFIKRFSLIVKNCTEKDILAIIDSFTVHKIDSSQLKEILLNLSSIILNGNKINQSEALKLISYVSRGQIINPSHPFTVELEKFIDQVDMNKLSDQDLIKPLMYLHAIHFNSRKIGAILINFVMKNPKILTENLLKAILSNYEEDKYPKEFFDFLNEYVQDNIKVGRLSVGIVSAFLFHQVKNKQLEISYFAEYENYICKNSQQYNWQTLDLHHILWSCLQLQYHDSKIFFTLEPKIYKAIFEEQILSRKITLFWELNQSALLMKHEALEIVLESFKKIFDLEKVDIRTASTFYHSLSLLIAKYGILDKENYLKSIKSMIGKYLSSIIPSFFKILQNHGYSQLDPESKVKIYQILSTINLDFPELISQFPLFLQFISSIEKENLSLNLKNSALVIDIVDLLQKMGLKFEKEKAIGVYHVDLMVEPNIAIEIDGLKHFSRSESKTQRHKDFLKEYYLLKKGYKLVRIPYYEFREIFFTEVDKRKEYLNTKIFGNQTYYSFFQMPILQSKLQIYCNDTRRP